jgi:hypothetical protein
VKRPRGVTLPIHLKVTGRVVKARADRFIHPDYEHMWNEGWRILCMESPGLVAEAAAHQSLVCRLSDAEARLEPCHIEALLSAYAIEPTQVNKVRGTVNVFLVPEVEKGRCRLISEPHTNALEGSRPIEPMLDLCGPEFLCDCDADGGIQDDFPWFYGQFEIPDHARDWYCFSYRGLWYRMVIIPTGGRVEPNIAHALTVSLARRAADVVNDPNAPRVVREGAYIDNVAFKGGELGATSAMLSFRRLAMEAGVTISDVSPCWTTAYDFLGVRIDHVSKTVALTSKTLAKLNQIAEVLANRPGEVTLGMLLRFLGLWVWGASVLGQIKASWYPLLKFVRRRVNSLQLEQYVRWWSSAFAAAVTITDLLASNPPRLCTAPAHGITAFSDASLVGWGVVIISPCSVTVRAGKWHRVEHIAALEARAFLRTVQALPRQEVRHFLRMMVDNTTVAGSIRRTRSTNFVVNKVVGEALSLAKEKGYVVEVEYVESINNIADDPSRCGCSVYFNAPCNIGAVEENEEESGTEGEAIDVQREWPSMLHLDPRWDASSDESGPNIHDGWEPSCLHMAYKLMVGLDQRSTKCTGWDRNVEPEAGGEGSSDSSPLGVYPRTAAAQNDQMRERMGPSNPRSWPLLTETPGIPYGQQQPHVVEAPTPGSFLEATDFFLRSEVVKKACSAPTHASPSKKRLSKRLSIRDILKPEERGL